MSGTGPAAGERRQLTVAFTDLVDSTVYASNLDPEDFHELLDAYQRRVAEVIASHGGTVTQFQGDGVIAYFGWPLASETATRDALSAGLDIVESVAHLAESVGLKGVSSLAARVGVHTGLVVVARATAGGLDRPADMFGEVPSVAARLQAAASPGQVIVSATTARQATGWFVMQPLGPLALKGFEFPIDALLVTARTGIRSRLETGDLTRFVNRHAEMNTLRSHWEAARLGRTRMVAVIGDPGIGKSRLVREFVSEWPNSSTVLRAACSERDSLSPLQPFAPLMGSAVKNPAEATSWIAERVRDHPSLLVVDDVQWADPSTVEVLENLAQRMLPLLLLVTARPDVDTRLESQTVPLMLGTLDPDDASLMVDSMSVEFPLAEDEKQQVVLRGAGIPLFLEELARSAHEEPRFGTRVSGRPPAAIADIVAARLDRLGRSKQTAQRAAVIGSEFSSPTLLATSDFGESETEQHLSELVRHGIVQTLDDGDYRFRHGLIQEIAYDSLLRRERRRLHSQIADALTSDPNAEPRPEIVAAHLGSGGRAIEAIPLWEKAARRAARRALFKEAAGHLTQVLALLDQIPEGHQRDEVESRIRLHLGTYQGAIDQGAPLAGENLRRSVELATRRNDSMTLVQALLTLAAHYQATSDYPAVHQSLDAAEEVAAEAGAEWVSPSIRLLRGPVWIWQGQFERGEQEIRPLFGLIGVPPTGTAMSMPGLIVDVVVGAYVMYGLAECLMGRPEEGFKFGLWASELAANKGSPHAQCLSWTTRAITHQLNGDVEQARTLAAQALALGDDKTTAQFRGWAEAVMAWADGRVPNVPARTEHPALFMRPYLLSLRADRVVDPESALELLNEALTIARTTGERFVEAELLRLKALREAETGDVAAAEAAIDEAVQIAGAQGARGLELRATAVGETILRSGS